MALFCNCNLAGHSVNTLNLFMNTKRDMLLYLFSITPVRMNKLKSFFRLQFTIKRKKVHAFLLLISKCSFVLLIQRQTNSFTLVQPPPSPPPLLQCRTRVHAISPELQHCIGGWGEEATHFKTDNSAFLKLRFKNTGN